MWPEGFPFADYVRQARRRRRLSQRGFAELVGARSATISRTEAGYTTPSVVFFEQLMSAADLLLVVAEPAEDGLRFVPPLVEVDGDCRDGADRRFPAHLDLVVDPWSGEWWGDIYGLARPPETFYRDQELRRVRRSMSQWETRHDGPPPRWPMALENAARRADRRRVPGAGICPACGSGRSGGAGLARLGP